MRRTSSGRNMPESARVNIRSLRTAPSASSLKLTSVSRLSLATRPQYRPSIHNSTPAASARISSGTQHCDAAGSVSHTFARSAC